MAEVPGTNVLVLMPLSIRVCQKIGGTTALEIPDRRGDMPVREVNETVATKNQIDVRKSVAGQVEQHEFRPIVAVETLVPSKELRDDVDAHVSLEREGRVLHPVEIAARRVEY